MPVAQEGGQLGQPDIHVGVATIPVQECANGKAVPQVVNASAAATSTKWAQASLTGRLTKPLPRHLVAQAGSPFPNEEAWADRLRIQLVANACVSFKRLHCRGMKRNQPRFVPLGAA